MNSPTRRNVMVNVKHDANFYQFKNLSKYKIINL